MVMTPDWESVGCEFKYRTFCFWKEKPSLISLILNTKLEKHDRGWLCLVLCQVISVMSDFYCRPQTKVWEGNVFTPVCDSFERGSLCQRGFLLGGGYPKGVCPWGSLSMGGLCMGISVKGISVWRSLCPGGSHLCSGGLISVQGGLISVQRGLCAWGLCQGDHPYGKERPVCILVENW